MSGISLIFIQPDGAEKTVEVTAGMTVMEAAIFNSVAGIEGMCGGICSCATCHVQLSPADFPKLGTPNDGEREMLDQLDNHCPTSRLGCQVPVSEAMQGLRIKVPGTES